MKYGIIKTINFVVFSLLIVLSGGAPSALHKTGENQNNQITLSESPPVMESKSTPVDKKTLLIKVADDIDLSRAKQVLGENVRIKKELKIIAVDYTDDSKKELSDKIKSNFSESTIEDDEPVKALLSPNDTLYTSQSYLSHMNIPEAWSLATGSSSVTVAVVDSGINGTHQDLTGKVIAGYDYVNSRTISANTDSDSFGHGTQMAGAIGAVGNNSKGIAGIDWRTRLMPVKILNSSGYGTTEDAIDGIRWATDNGADVINMSFGRSTPSSALEEAVGYARSKGVILVGASGNDGISGVVYPARYDGVLSVGSTDTSRNRASFSNYGDELDLVAPGISISTTSDSNASYVSVSGTSVSAALVTGIVSLEKSFHSGLNDSDIISLIINNANKVSGMGGQDDTDYYGYGIPNAYESMIGAGDYQGSISYWSSSDGGFTYPQMIPGNASRFTLKVKNTGHSTWVRGVVNLGTDLPEDRVPSFIRESTDGSPSGWISSNRVGMQESTVAPGQTATYTFYLKAPSNMGVGTYREAFRLVADGITWVKNGTGIYWDVKVLAPSEQYIGEITYWSTSAGAFKYPTISQGSASKFTLKIKNTGKATWEKGVVNLGTDLPEDRVPSFIRESTDGSPSGWISSNRVGMQESTVAPGQTATYTFYLKAPSNMGVGTYREAFRLVADGITWVKNGTGIYWDVKVK